MHAGRTASAFTHRPADLSSRRLRGLPVLVHEASRRVWGLRLRRTEQELAISPPPVLPSANAKSVGVPNCIFWELNTQPACTPVYASPCTSRRTTQNSGPSGSLLLSRRTLAFPTSCRLLRKQQLIPFEERTLWARQSALRCRAALGIEGDDAHDADDDAVWEHSLRH
jgi:hypothetical protein